MSSANQHTKAPRKRAATQIRLTEELHAELAEEAARRKMAVSDVIRERLEAGRPSGLTASEVEMLRGIVERLSR